MQATEEIKGLKKISEISIYTSLLIIPLTVVVSKISGSETLVIYYVWAAAAIAVKIFAFFSTKIMLRQNSHMFPYGPGKLENFSSFFFGCSIVPVGAYYLGDSVVQLFHPRQEVTFLLCQVPVILSIVLTLLLQGWTRKLIRKNPYPSPLLSAYFINFRISLASDVILYIGFLAGWLLSISGLTFFSLRVDPFLSLLLSVYMIRVGLPLVTDNFRSLIDLPLPEEDMLKILRVVAEFNRDYSGFGMLYSRRSGKLKIVELELFFDRAVSLEEVRRIESRMGERLGQMLDGLRFSLLPKLMGQAEPSVQ